MPISADKVQDIIEIAVLGLKTTDELRQTLSNIKQDARNLKSLAADNDAVRLEIADAILDRIEVGMQTDIAEKYRQEIYQERVKFQMNFNKNRKRREAKRKDRLNARSRNEEITWERETYPGDDLTTREIQERLNWLDAHPGQKYPEPEPQPEPQQILQTGTDADTYDPPSLPSRKKQVEAE